MTFGGTFLYNNTTDKTLEAAFKIEAGDRKAVLMFHTSIAGGGPHFGWYRPTFLVPCAHHLVW
jgi:hypothetical protein